MRSVHLFPFVILFGIIIAQNSALVINQILADYSTNYNYGVKGTRQVIEYISDNELASQTYFPIYDLLYDNIIKDNQKYYINRNYYFNQNRIKDESQIRNISFLENNCLSCDGSNNRMLSEE